MAKILNKIVIRQIICYKDNKKMINAVSSDKI